MTVFGQQAVVPPFPATDETAEQYLLRCLRGVLAEMGTQTSFYRGVVGVPIEGRWRKLPKMLRNRLRKHPELRSFRVDVRRPNRKSDLVMIWLKKKEQ